MSTLEGFRWRSDFLDQVRKRRRGRPRRAFRKSEAANRYSRLGRVLRVAKRAEKRATKGTKYGVFDYRLPIVHPDRARDTERSKKAWKSVLKRTIGQKKQRDPNRNTPQNLSMTKTAPKGEDGAYYNKVGESMRFHVIEGFLDEKVGEPFKSKAKRLLRKADKAMHRSMTTGEWDPIKARQKRDPNTGVKQYHRVHDVLMKHRAKGSTKGGDLGHTWLKSAGDSRKALALAKKRGRTRKHQNKLKNAAMGNIHLSKSSTFKKRTGKLPG